MVKVVLSVVVCLLLSGCATIVGESTQSRYLESDPVGAQFVISDNHGVVSARGVTPQRVTLPKSDNRYFGKLTYNVTFLHAGYYPTLVPLQTRATHWYTFGNLLFLGVPGWFVVDPFNGGMYDIYPQRVNALMQPCPRGPWRDTCE